MRPSLVYGTQWQKIRLAVLERDDHECQIRGEGCTGKATQVDHIIGWRQGGALYDPENLRAACHGCNTRRQKRGHVGSGRRRPSREW